MGLDFTTFQAMSGNGVPTGTGRTAIKAWRRKIQRVRQTALILRSQAFPNAFTGADLSFAATSTAFGIYLLHEEKGLWTAVPITLAFGVSKILNEIITILPCPFFSISKASGPF
jgi:hypothetical protein